MQTKAINNRFFIGEWVWTYYKTTKFFSYCAKYQKPNMKKSLKISTKVVHENNLPVNLKPNKKN